MLRIPRNRRTILFGCLFIFIGAVIFIKSSSKLWKSCTLIDKADNADLMLREEKFAISSDKKTFVYNRDMPLTFIGGVPRLVKHFNFKLLI